MTGDRRSGAPTPAPFEAVVAEHGPMVMRICRAILGSIDADDAWVETFVSAMRAYPSLPADSNVGGWLATIAHNRAIDQVRAARRRPTPTDILPEDRLRRVEDPTAVHDTTDDALSAALGSLAPKQRTAVVLRHLADLPYADIARLLDISEPAARRNTSDGIANLRNQLTGSTP
jgi:RNA polymerase sigma factor (sigma-70 family)